MSFLCECCDNVATRWALCDWCYSFMNHPSYDNSLKGDDETGTVGD